MTRARLLGTGLPAPFERDPRNPLDRLELTLRPLILWLGLKDEEIAHLVALATIAPTPRPVSSPANGSRATAASVASSWPRTGRRRPRRRRPHANGRPMRTRDPCSTTASAGTTRRSPAGRRSFLRGVLDQAAGKVTPLTGQGSHQIATLGKANALVVVPEWVVQMSEGDPAEVLVLP